MSALLLIILEISCLILPEFNRDGMTKKIVRPLLGSHICSSGFRYKHSTPSGSHKALGCILSIIVLESDESDKSDEFVNQFPLF